MKLDVFFISNGEEIADENYARLVEVCPRDVQRVDGVKGIYEVHKTCAHKSTTENFFVVDADAWVHDNFDWDFAPNPKVKHFEHKETDCVLIWPSFNPVNDLCYGYGGIKCFPRAPFLEDPKWDIDLSTTIGAVPIAMEGISCETKFNYTPKTAFIGAFRECAKLASLQGPIGRWTREVERHKIQLDELEQHIFEQKDWTDDQRTKYRKGQKAIINDSRLDQRDLYSYFAEIEENARLASIWCRVGYDKPNGDYAIHGARAGFAFGLKNAQSKEMRKINDWAWLEAQFNESV
jgi:hypothetical protein